MQEAATTVTTGGRHCRNFNSMHIAQYDLQSQRLMHAAGVTIAVAIVCVFTWLLLIPDPYAASQAFEPLRRARISGYLIHPCVYLCIAVTTLINVPTNAKNLRSRVLMLIVAHGLITEMLQYFIPGRSCDPFDVVANLSGILAAIALDRFRREVFDTYSRVIRLAYVD